MGRTKFYAVRKGRKPGVYSTWAEAERQVHKFPAGLHRSFSTLEAAQKWIGGRDKHSGKKKTRSDEPSPGSTQVVKDDPDLTQVPEVKTESASHDPIATELEPQIMQDSSVTPIDEVKSAPDVSPESLPKSEPLFLPGPDDEPPVQPSTSDLEPLAPVEPPPPGTHGRIAPIQLDDPIHWEDLPARPGGWPTPVALHGAATWTPAVPVNIPADVENKEPVLSDQQKRVLDTIMNGQNYFFTGSAGTGKSVLLRTIVKAFGKKQKESHAAEALITVKKEVVGQMSRRETFPDAEAVQVPVPWHLAVTASTGMAAVNIGGCTLHSWAGVGLGTDTRETLCRIVYNFPPTRTRWQLVSALLIDEISMIDADLLDKLDYIGRQVRHDSRPFGGIQVILCGDFFQLPPVHKNMPGGPPLKFAFEADCCIYRQEDEEFVSILENMRKGICLERHQARLRACQRNVMYDDGIEPVGLYPSRKEVRKINSDRLAALRTPLVEYKASDMPGVDVKGVYISQDRATKLLDDNTLWLPLLQLRVGAMVMLVTNMGGDSALVNGSTGIVEDFVTVEDARAKKVHLPPKAGMYSHPAAALWPVVRFTPSRYATTPQYELSIIPGMHINVMNANGTAEATRYQVPLILAWALTIHKSQGQTIERVRIDLRKVFVEGQAYVAISRATSLDALQILNFSRNKIRAHARVARWSVPIERAQKEEEEYDKGWDEVDFEALVAAGL